MKLACLRETVQRVTTRRVVYFARVQGLEAQRRGQ